MKMAGVSVTECLLRSYLISHFSSCAARMDPERWPTGHVCLWLQDSGLGVLSAEFRERKLTGADILRMLSTCSSLFFMRRLACFTHRADGGAAC